MALFNCCTFVRARPAHVAISVAPEVSEHENEDRHCLGHCTAFGRFPRMTHYHPVGVSREDHPLRGMTRRYAMKQNDSLCYTQLEQNGLSQKGFRCGMKYFHHQIPKNKSGNAVHRRGTRSVLSYQRLQIEFTNSVSCLLYCLPF